MSKSGLLIVISAPSGAGKTSLVNALLERDRRLEVSVSYTTRDKRPAEVDGKDYYFVDETTFANMRAAGAFLETAENFGKAYGTARAKAVEILDTGRDLVLEIDWQGATQVRKNFASTLSIFILPPSVAAIAERLNTRAQDDEHAIERRAQQAVADISHYDEFDYVVVNDDFDTALADLADIIDAERRGEKAQIERPKALLEKLLDRRP